jgi:hypothetical protein
MKYERKTTRHTWTDYRTNTEIAKGLNTTPGWTVYRKTEETGCNTRI